MSAFTTLDKYTEGASKGSQYAVAAADPTDHGTFYNDNHGYQVFRGTRSENTISADKDDNVVIHRLVAVAEHGIEAVKGKHIHHKNGVKWDNRPENLEPLSNSEHQKRESNNTALSVRLDQSAGEHIASALSQAGYTDAADMITDS